MAVVPDGAELSDLVRGGPVGVAEIELTDGLATLRDTVGPPREGRVLLVLARLHSHPIACLTLADDAEDPEITWPRAARTALVGALDRHLRADGLKLGALDLWAGGAELVDPPCLDERRRTLESAPGVTVIIGTRDRSDRLDACLKTVLALDYPAFDVLVVDNDPTTSDTAELVAARGAATGKIAYLREDRRDNRGIHRRRRRRGPVLAKRARRPVRDQHPGGWGIGIDLASCTRDPGAEVARGPRPLRQGVRGPTVRPGTESTRRRAVPLRRRKARLGGQHGI
jgi:hypothetical protein